MSAYDQMNAILSDLSIARANEPDASKFCVLAMAAIEKIDALGNEISIKSYGEAAMQVIDLYRSYSETEGSG